MMLVCKDSRVVMKGKKKSGLYILLRETDLVEEANVASNNVSCTELWHKRMGHISDQGLQYISKQGLLGNDHIDHLDFCESCVLGKQHRLSFSKGQHCSREVLEYVHSNLWGPAQIRTYGGNLYFLSIVDDYSRKVWIYLLK